MQAGGWGRNPSAPGFFVPARKEVGARRRRDRGDEGLGGRVADASLPEAEAAMS